MFDWGLLPSQTFKVPVISVGNLSVGGTGKTPHIEYLAEYLLDKYKVAILSRGYKRKTKGYLEANSASTVNDIGDEPFQYFKKYKNNVIIAVDGNRRRGISNILKNYPDTDVILLDDAFQHRYVKPALNILLTDYRNLFVNDYVLPTGYLREFRRGAKRADVLVVTKTPKVFSPIDKELILKQISKYLNKKILFSYIQYDKLQPVTKACKKKHPAKIKSVFLLTGIANTSPLEEYIKRISDEIYHLRYSDHHKYSKKDVEEIIRFYNEVFSGDKAIVTTEKDLMRLQNTELIDFFNNIPLYYLPIKIKFHENGDKKIKELVENLIT